MYIGRTSKNNKLKVYIGTDSIVKNTVTEYATVIVFLREKMADLCLFIMNPILRKCT